MKRAYCINCRLKRIIQEEKQIQFSNGKSGIEGICSSCGRKVIRIGE